MRGVFRYLAIVVLLLFVGNEASAQWMKERGWVRKGNRQYAKSNYEQSVVNYENALKYDSLLFEAKYDLASALYRTERYDKAEGILMSLLSDTTRTELERGEVSYNLGNTQFAQKKYKEALASYRYAMRCNPNDEDAKFNYAFTKLKLQDQQQQQQQNQDKKDNEDNKDQNQDQNQQGQDNKDQQDKQDKDKQDDKQNKDQQNDQNRSQQPQNKEGGDKQQEGQNSESEMKQAQHEAILQAVQAEEDKTQDKLKEKAAVVVVGGKNW